MNYDVQHRGRDPRVIKRQATSMRALVKFIDATGNTEFAAIRTDVTEASAKRVRSNVPREVVPFHANRAWKYDFDEGFNASVLEKDCTNNVDT